jgi:hypothetical protein
MGFFPLINGIIMRSPGLLYKLLSPLTLFTVPMIQRFNYWINMGIKGDYDTYRKNHENLIPYVFKPLASMGSIKYKTIVHYDEATTSEEEFKKDVQNNTVIAISNHVDFSDFAVLIRLAVNYGIESRAVAYFASFVGTLPFIGPSLMAQIPLTRDTGHPEKDEKTLDERLKMYAESDHKEIFLIFPEGGLRRNPDLFERTKEKKNKFGIDSLNYVNYPKAKGFRKLIETVGHKMTNLYELILLYDEQNLYPTGNEVHVLVRKVCKVSDLPKTPSAEFVAKHNIALDAENTLHYAHEEFLLKRFEEMNDILTQWYEQELKIDKNDAPTNANIYKIRTGKNPDDI